MLSSLAITGVVILYSAQLAEEKPVNLPASAHNLLVDATVSGNLEAYEKGLRGAADHMIYDLQRARFVKPSQWHEYGVGFAQDLGVVSEQRPAFWMAQWTTPVTANLIMLSGAYPNQPQPKTAWKIDIRLDGTWTTHARGLGGWYNHGRYIWGGLNTRPLRFDALRVSLFSADGKTPLKSIHFRGEEGSSWVVARLVPIDAWIGIPRQAIRVGREVELAAQATLGKIQSWKWDFGDGSTAEGQTVRHAFTRTGPHDVRLAFSDGTHTADVRSTVDVVPPIEARITPLRAPLMVGQPVEFDGGASVGSVKTHGWDFGDGKKAAGSKVRHTFAEPGIYKVTLSVADDRYRDRGMAIVRVHTHQTLHVPQVVLDTDQKNEQDDQHYFGYGLFSELDVLGVNSIHHGGGQEPVNYAELLHVLELANKSGLPKHRRPLLFHGANKRLDVPPSRKWQDTRPIVTEASEAILAAARGASPSNPVWVVPVGPGTNTASAILQACAEGLELKDRLRVMWLGGTTTTIPGRSTWSAAAGWKPGSCRHRSGHVWPSTSGPKPNSTPTTPWDSTSSRSFRPATKPSSTRAAWQPSSVCGSALVG